MNETFPLGLKYYFYLELHPVQYAHTHPQTNRGNKQEAEPWVVRLWSVSSISYILGILLLP